MPEIWDLVQKEIGRSSESKRHTHFPSLSLVTNTKVAKNSEYLFCMYIYCKLSTIWSPGLVVSVSG